MGYLYLGWHGSLNDEPCRAWWDEGPCAHGATDGTANTSYGAESA